MTDLPTRLREHAAMVHALARSSSESICCEAAKEIERLQAENAATAADIESQVAASSELATELEELRKANEWRPMSEFPKQERVHYDLWCVYGYEGVSSWTGDYPVGHMESRRHWSAKYGWFGNQSPEGLPQVRDKDLRPVAWRVAPPPCPIEVIEQSTGWKVQPQTPDPESDA